MRYFILLVVSIAVASCNGNSTSTPDKESFKQEIIAAEKSFCETAKEKGIAEAFYLFADSNAVVKTQSDSLLHGPAAIREAWADPIYADVTMTWAPDYVDVSDDGTLGWTYGHYTMIGKDSVGAEESFTGLFHTVWKKQKDGNWKFVWD